MDNIFSVAWFKAAAARAVRTMAQVGLSYITVGAAISDVQWGNLVSVALVAMVYSFLTSILIGIPEV